MERFGVALLGHYLFGEDIDEVILDEDGRCYLGDNLGAVEGLTG